MYSKMNQDVPINQGHTVSIVCSRVAALPAHGTIQWTRKESGRLCCGIRFTQASATWSNWFNQHAAA
jgi:hypothetical protein